MSKIDNHRVEIQETEAYQNGWDMAENGHTRPHVSNTRCFDAHSLMCEKQGWDDWHKQEHFK